MTRLRTVHGYIDRAWSPIPVPKGQKAPTLRGWTDLRIDHDDASAYFSDEGNIGVLLGAASKHLIDIDLDCREAVALADRLLPPTDCVFGRAGAPRSHRIYRAHSTCGPTRKFQGPAGEKIVEYRGDGGQTVFPGSVHPSGERVEWECDGDPTCVDPDELRVNVGELAAACLLLRKYPREKSCRHDIVLSLAGGLLRAGWGVEKVEWFVRTIAEAAGDEEVEGRMVNVRSTARRIQNDANVTGWPSLSRLIDGEQPGDRIVSKVREHLGIVEMPLAPAAPTIVEAPAAPDERPLPRPVPASDLSPEGAEVEWVLEGYIAAGHTTLFTSLWKCGKSTWVAHLLKQMGAGGDLAGRVARGKALVIAEESASLWARRRDELGIGDHAHFLIQPFLVKPMSGEWDGFICDMAALVRANGYRVVIFDTFGTVSPLLDENDAAKMTAALLPLNGITEAGAAVLLVHHPRKGDGGEGQASRGSGALPGFVDIIIEMRRFRADEPDDRRRVLRAFSRFTETPAESVIELSEDRSRYAYIGSRKAAAQADIAGALREILPAEPPGFTAKELKDAWASEMTAPGVRTLQKALNTGATEGQWSRSGEGKSGDPYRYFLSGNRE